MDEPIEVVTTVGALDAVVVLLREFLHRSGAVRAVALVAHDGTEAVVDCARLMPIEVTTGDVTVALPHAIDLDAPALPVPDVRQLPPFDVDAASGEIAAPLGGVQHYADAVGALAGALPGPHSVALATWATSDADTPLSISARTGEPSVLALGEEQFELGQ